jgi:hypothetical protein
VVLLGSLSSLSAQTSFDVTGAVNTFPVAVNNSGTVAGYYIDSTNGFHGFVRDSTGNITTFNPPADTAAGSVVLWSMNNVGATVGTYTNNSVQTGFLRSASGSFTDIAPTGATLVNPLISINDFGQIAGSWTDSSLPRKSHGFIVDVSGNYTTFDIAGAVTINIAKINNSGQIAGYYSDSSSNSHGFVREPKGTITVIDPPVAGARIQVMGMNDSEEVTGFYTADNNATFHGFVWTTKGNKIATFDVSGQSQTLAQSINSNGAIVGYACTNFNNCAAFIRTPPAHGQITGTGTFSSFTVTGAADTEPTSINDIGVVAGPWVAPTTFVRHGFIR